MRCITSGTFASRATHSGSVLRRSYSGWEWRDWRTVRTNARRCASCSGSSPFSLAMSALRREMVAERYTLLMGACMVSSLLIAALSVRASLLLHSSGGRCRDARLAAVARRRAGSPARGNCRRRGLPDPRGPPRRLRACPRNRSSVRLARSAGCVESSPSPSALPSHRNSPGGAVRRGRNGKKMLERDPSHRVRNGQTVSNKNRDKI